jgi:hypothetical protein
MAELLTSYYQRHRDCQEQVEALVAIDHSVAKLESRINSVVIEFGDVDEHRLTLQFRNTSDYLPVYVWQLLVALLSLGYANPQLRRLLRYAKEIVCACHSLPGRHAGC